MSRPNFQGGKISRGCGLLAATALALISGPGFAQEDDFGAPREEPALARVFGDAQPRFFAPAAMRGGPAAATAVVPGCPTFGPWDAQHGLTEAQLLERLEVLEAEGARPISISATADDVGGSVRFDITSVVDAFGDPDQWDVLIGQTREEVNALTGDFRPAAIDAYSAPQGIAYAAIVVKDGRTARTEVELPLSDILADDVANQVGGYTPIWIDGFRRDGLTRYSAIWIDDGVPRRLETEPVSREDLDSRWRARSSDGLRMLRMTRFLAVDAADGDPVARHLAV